MDELIQILEDSLSPSEIIEILKSFDEDKLRDYGIKNDICVNCGGDLILHRWEESRPEFWGFPCREEMCEIICVECGEIY
jgi:hypothetical protein